MAITAIDAPGIRGVRFWASTNGKKAVMAVTGVILFAFVVFHMLGNLQVFEGAEQMNFYGLALRRFPEALWAVRAILLVSVIAHIWASTVLAIQKKKARPVGYGKRKNISSDYSSRTMYWSGPILLAFVIYHLLHMTFGTVHPDFREGLPYENVVSGFQVWWVSAWYIFSMLLLGLHIRHGAWSAFQSLGANHPRHTPMLKKAAMTLAIVVTAGYISIPVAVMLGLVR
jgi:succinate dehydrogenase / fumarate reductase, cytochrome b subunit